MHSEKKKKANFLLAFCNFYFKKTETLYQAADFAD